jgi:hypothetical protein
MNQKFQDCKSKKRTHGSKSLQLLIDEYLAHWGNSYEIEDEWWGDKTLTWEEALTRAWGSRFSDGKMHGHQRRVSKNLLLGLKVALEDRKQPVNFHNFQTLHDWVKSVSCRVRGLGVTTSYDVARRLGAWLDLKPDRVYLHAGTANGANVFGIQGETAPLSMFPREIQALGATHTENFLCIYKERLSDCSNS